jgi:FKBP-type peptidyl-prolyl cis-trans isomerase
LFITQRLQNRISVALIILLAGCSTDPYRAPFDVAAAPASAITLADGLAYKVLKPGSGNQHPTLASTIVANYTGWTTDGKKFDSTVNPDGSANPATFPLDKLIEGWQRVVPLMVDGEKVRVWIPGKLAYDNRNRPDAPHGMLVFDIQLVKFTD